MPTKKSSTKSSDSLSTASTAKKTSTPTRKKLIQVQPKKQTQTKKAQGKKTNAVGVIQPKNGQQNHPYLIKFILFFMVSLGILFFSISLSRQGAFRSSNADPLKYVATYVDGSYRTLKNVEGVESVNNKVLLAEIKGGNGSPKDVLVLVSEELDGVASNLETTTFSWMYYNGKADEFRQKNIEGVSLVSSLAEESIDRLDVLFSQMGFRHNKYNSGDGEVIGMKAYEREFIVCRRFVEINHSGDTDSYVEIKCGIIPGEVAAMQDAVE